MKRIYYMLRFPVAHLISSALRSLSLRSEPRTLCAPLLPRIILWAHVLLLYIEKLHSKYQVLAQLVHCLSALTSALTSKLPESIASIIGILFHRKDITEDLSFTVRCLNIS